jgi:hypothetical protein
VLFILLVCSETTGCVCWVSALSCLFVAAVNASISRLAFHSSFQLLTLRPELAYIINLPPFPFPLVHHLVVWAVSVKRLDMSEEAGEEFHELIDIHGRTFQNHSIQHDIYHIPVDEVNILLFLALGVAASIY